MATKLKEPSDEDIGAKGAKSSNDNGDDDKHEIKEDKKTKNKKTIKIDSDGKDSAKKESKKKVESVVDDDNDGKKKRPKNISSRIDSKIPSVEEEEDQLKDKKRHKYLKKIISHLCLLVFVLAFQSLVLGLAAQYFYSGKEHLFMFGMFSIIQLIGAPIGFWAIQGGNRLLLLLCVVFNGIWMIVVIIMILYYWLISNSDQFNQEIALHVSAIFFLSASFTLGVMCFILMKQIEMINISSQPKRTKDKDKDKGKDTEKEKRRDSP